MRKPDSENHRWRKPKQPDSGHFFKRNYDSKGRFCSYWHQIDEIKEAFPGEILEIGVGNGFVSDYLKKRDREVTTLDIDPGLNPDVVGNVTALPFPDLSFDICSCCEVLEHLCFTNFQRSLGELHRVTRRVVVLSLPDARLVYPLHLQIPRLGVFRAMIPKPLGKGLRKPCDEHYWEISQSGHSRRKIARMIQSVGFKIEREYRVFEMPGIHFFVLWKDESSG